MKKRIISIILTLCMVLTFVPITVFAAEGITPTTPQKDSNGVYQISTAAELYGIAKLENDGNTDFSSRLMDDINLSSTLNIIGSIVLDLNGHVIRMTDNGSVILVKGSLTLEDSNPTAAHTGENVSLPAGGVITGGKDSHGAGVNINPGASFVMNGGTIIECIAENGGGVSIGGSFVMNGGTISECGATMYGGGVYNNGSFVMNGGSIENCYAGSYGDGVYNAQAATVMKANGGKITGLGSNAADLIIEKDTDKTGTTFYGTVTNSNTINAGIYKASVINGKVNKDAAPGTISGGTFEGGVVNTEGGIISDGIFNYEVRNQTDSTISGGTFMKPVENKGTVSGGVYYGGIENKDSGTVTGTQYTVSFDLCGGSGSVRTQMFVNVSTAKALKPANPTKEGYVFAGWYNGDTEYGFTETVKKSITLTAKWVTGEVSSESEFNLTINSGITSIKLVDDINLSSILDLSNKEITLDLNGYTLTGNIELADTAEEPQSILTLIDSNPKAIHTDSNLPAGGVINGAITLTRANGNGTASHLYANGGTVTGRVSTITDIARIYCTSSTPTAFTGTVGYYGEIHGGIFYGSTNDGCIKEKTVTFMNGSSRYALEVVADGSNAVAPIPPSVKAGYQAFDGWYNGDTKYTFGSALSDNITLTAKFSNPITYNIDCDLDGGTATNPATYNVESETVTLNNPVKTGYTFTGWSGTDLIGEDNMTVTVPKSSIGDRTYTAHYSEKSGYSVEFDTDGGSSVDSKKDLKWTDKVLEGITAPAKEGWEFVDWQYEGKTVDTETAYKELAASDEVMIIELKAQWKDVDAPVISGIENGKTYCSAQTVSVSDNDVIASVTVNGNPATLDENNQFTLKPAEGTQTIVVTDKAGNVSAEMIVTVNDGHTDENPKDHLCDICGANVGTHEDKDKDHKCDYGCSEPIGEDEPTPDEVLVGDANGDGRVNVKDVTEIQKAAASIVVLDDVQQKAADVNGDGSVNVKDATAIQKYIAGIETGYKIGEYILFSQG